MTDLQFKTKSPHNYSHLDESDPQTTFIKNADPLPCNFCDATFNSLHALHYHRKTVHGIAKEKTSTQCDLCSKKFSRVAGLTLHKRVVHEKIRAFNCEHCGKTFSSNAHLTDHVQGVHEKAKLFPCPVCGRHYGRATHLRKHLRSVHKRDVLYCCDDCGQVFVQEQNLASHVTTVHNGPFPCELCQKKMTSQRQLNVHLRSAHKDKEARPHHCQLCDRTYKTRPHLNVHVQSFHSVEKVWQCTECGERFRYPTGMRRHRRKYHCGAVDEAVVARDVSRVQLAEHRGVAVVEVPEGDGVIEVREIQLPV